MDPLAPRHLAGAVAWIGLGVMMFASPGGPAALAVGLAGILGFVLLRRLPDRPPVPRANGRTVWIEAVIEDRRVAPASPSPRTPHGPPDRTAEDLAPLPSALLSARARRELRAAARRR